MSAISEDSDCAGWISQWEDPLWPAVLNGPVAAGFWNVLPADIDRLRRLVRRCGGWIVSNLSLLKETWLSIESWLCRDAEHIAIRAKSPK